MNEYARLQFRSYDLYKGVGVESGGLEGQHHRLFVKPLSQLRKS